MWAWLIASVSIVGMGVGDGQQGGLDIAIAGGDSLAEIHGADSLAGIEVAGDALVAATVADLVVTVDPVDRSTLPLVIESRSKAPSPSSGPGPAWMPPMTDAVETTGWVTVVLLAAVATARAGLFGIALFSRIRGDDLLKNALRARIIGCIEDAPGITKQQLRQTLGTASGTVVYHVQRLADAGLIISSWSHGRRRYWVNGAAGHEERQQRSALSSSSTRSIAEEVVAAPGIQPTILCERLGISRPTASKHLRKLAEAGLVVARADHKKRLYFPTESMQKIVAAS